MQRAQSRVHSLAFPLLPPKPRSAFLNAFAPELVLPRRNYPYAAKSSGWRCLTTSDTCSLSAGACSNDYGVSCVIDLSEGKSNERLVNVGRLEPPLVFTVSGADSASPEESEIVRRLTRPRAVRPKRAKCARRPLAAPFKSTFQ